MRKQRISVSLPPDMMAHYKVLAEASGISVSRLIYLRLRSKKSIIIVGQEMLNTVKELKTLVRQLLHGKPPSDDVVQSLVQYTRFLEKFVELDGDDSEVVRGGGRRGD